MGGGVGKLKPLFFLGVNMPCGSQASVAFDSVTNYRASTDYGIADSSMPLQPDDFNFNIGAASLLGFALALRPVQPQIISPSFF